MAVGTVANLLQTLRAQRLLEPECLEQLARVAPQFTEPHTLAKNLLQRGWLTPFQVNTLLKGRGQELVLGSYVLLERLGAGGMGEVFKARHLAMGRVVALKVVRKELMSNPDSVKRFHREIRAVAQLSHPNIVMAFDADQVNGSHYFAMEYVEGVDLGRLVKTRGPLPVRDACDAIRQAALGLQHAHEKGMVHRDIKPTNLLRANQGGVVKVLDMGLAHFKKTDGENSSLNGAAELNGTQLTQAGRIMGTPDYIAPEQARNSHGVDIRADLYGLGCTFFYLLTGSVPFAGGTAMDKLFRHQAEEASPVEQLRPEVSPAIGGVIRKLLAKQPEKRYQTPGELATALTLLNLPRALPVLAPARRPTVVASYPVMAAVAAQVPPNSAVLRRAGRASEQRTPRLSWGWFALAGLGVLMLAASLLLILPALRLRSAGPSRSGEPKDGSRTTAAASDAPKEPAAAYLSDLRETDASVGLGKFGKNGDLGYDNRRISFRSAPAPKGLALIPPNDATALVTYPLNKQYRDFKTTVALNDRPKVDRTIMLFRVLGDDKLLWESRRLASGEAQECNVSVAGVEQLKLTVTCIGRHRNNSGIWVEPRLLAEGADR